jgi:putative photosynthetic complex assembly protein
MISSTLAAPNTARAEAPASIRLPLMAAGAMVVLSIAAVAAVRWSGMPIGIPDSPAVFTRVLTFTDRADGGIDVTDVRTKQLVETVTGQAGFIRGTLRGMARERRRGGIGVDSPFELVAHADGRLTLFDPSTSRLIDLESFGPTNEADFAKMLTSP